MRPKLRASLNKEILTWESNEALIICYLWGPFPSVLHHDPVRGLQFKDNWVLCKQIPEGTRKIGIIYQYEWSGKIVRFLLIKVYYEWEYYGQSHLHTGPISRWWKLYKYQFHGKVMFPFHVPPCLCSSSRNVDKQNARKCVEIITSVVGPGHCET